MFAPEHSAVREDNLLLQHDTCH